MEKVIKKYGNTNVVVITKEEMFVNNLKIGDVVEVKKKK